MSKKLEEKVNNIPGEDGWWKSTSQDKYQKLAKLLVSKGLSEDEAIDVLTRAYFAAVGCFGG